MSVQAVQIHILHRVDLTSLMFNRHLVKHPAERARLERMRSSLRQLLSDSEAGGKELTALLGWTLLG
jgi:hypothetical protein